MGRNVDECRRIMAAAEEQHKKHGTLFYVAENSSFWSVLHSPRLAGLRCTCMLVLMSACCRHTRARTAPHPTPSHPTALSMCARICVHLCV